MVYRAGSGYIRHHFCVRRNADDAAVALRRRPCQDRRDPQRIRGHQGRSARILPHFGLEFDGRRPGRYALGGEKRNAVGGHRIYCRGGGLRGRILSRPERRVRRAERKQQRDAGSRVLENQRARIAGRYLQLACGRDDAPAIRGGRVRPHACRNDGRSLAVLRRRFARYGGVDPRRGRDAQRIRHSLRGRHRGL